MGCQSDMCSLLWDESTAVSQKSIAVGFGSTCLCSTFKFEYLYLKRVIAHMSASLMPNHQVVVSAVTSRMLLTRAYLGSCSWSCPYLGPWSCKNCVGLHIPLLC